MSQREGDLTHFLWLCTLRLGEDEKNNQGENPTNSAAYDEQPC